MTTNMMYDPTYVAARLAAHRRQLAQPAKGQTMKRKDLTSDEYNALHDLVAGRADDDTLAAFADQHNLHRSTLRSLVSSIRHELDTDAAQAAPLPPPIFSPPAVPDTPLPPSAPAVVTVAPPPPPAAGVDTIIHWLTTIRALRDDLRDHGVLVEGRVTITVDL